eukprot:TRINITY_DN14248_c0_g1_i1.p1 TRINITY_DN14248_c0_g1~~TRINITY_DN14248_c0_g1_i1.p1  ORF type:complete len:238 (+),score=47.43 TRINITY_DN14248_c0_g1_i1:22-714(+)
MESPAVVCPAHPAFWDAFYDAGGQGEKTYEWFMGFPGYWPALVRWLRDDDVLLHPGCGNSLFPLHALQADDCVRRLRIVSCDFCALVVERMRAEASAWPLKLQGRLQFVEEDVCKMTFQDGSFTVIFDKGMLDAFFSNAEPEEGTNPNVQKYVAEAYRVLCPGGRFIVISTNNDADLVCQYFYDQDWDVAHEPLEIDNKGACCVGGRRKGPRTLYTLYALTKPLEAPPTV